MVTSSSQQIKKRVLAILVVEETRFLEVFLNSRRFYVCNQDCEMIFLLCGLWFEDVKEQIEDKKNDDT